MQILGPQSLPSYGSGAASGWAVRALAQPEFWSSVNPITTRGADYAHLITTGPPGFSEFPMALVSAEDEPIVAAAEDKNPGEVVAVAEANSLNEAVKLLKRPTTIEPGKVGYLA